MFNKSRNAFVGRKAHLWQNWRPHRKARKTQNNTYKQIKSMTPARDPKLGFVCYHDLGGIWEASGRHLGGIWEASGSLLVSIWRQLGGWRLKRHLEGRSQIMCLTLQRNAKVPLKCQFHEGLLRVPSIMTAYLQSDMVGGFFTDPADRSRALYQHRENPIS